MLTIRQSVDQGAQSITWTFEATEPEHERHGVRCHAFDGAIMSDHLRQMARNLGYVLVCAEEAAPPVWGYTEYWTRRYAPDDSMGVVVGDA